jgi:hypothetical protein
MFAAETSAAPKAANQRPDIALSGAPGGARGLRGWSYASRSPSECASS